MESTFITISLGSVPLVAHLPNSIFCLVEADALLSEKPFQMMEKGSIVACVVKGNPTYLEGVEFGL